MTHVCALHDELADNSVEAQAAHWFARNRNDQAHDSRAAFQAWLAEPANAQAYAQLEQLWLDLAELKPQNPTVPVTVRRKNHWRPALALAAALLCALLTLNLGMPQTIYSEQLVAQTTGTRTLDLPDGSILYVNRNTRVRIDFTADQRNLYLDAGQVYLEVAPDRERPLWVHAGGASVRVVGTGFDVRRGQRQLVVSVAHGLVAFAPGSRKADPLLLGAHQRAFYDEVRGTLHQQTFNDEDAADWRSGRLAFRNRDLASLVDELNLYRASPVILADSAVAALKVSGSLDVNDPDALLKALPALLPVKTVALNDGRVRLETRH